MCIVAKIKKCIYILESDPLDSWDVEEDPIITPDEEVIPNFVVMLRNGFKLYMYFVRKLRN